MFLPLRGVVVSLFMWVPGGKPGVGRNGEEGEEALGCAPSMSTEVPYMNETLRPMVDGYCAVGWLSCSDRDWEVGVVVVAERGEVSRRGGDKATCRAL